MLKSDLARQKLLARIEVLRATGENRLPPERVLADELGCARSTVVKILGEFASENLVVRKIGSGTYLRAESTAAPLKVAVVMRRAYYRSDYHFRLILDTLAEFAAEFGVSIHIFDAAADMFRDDPQNNPLLRAIRARAVDSALIVSRMPLAASSALASMLPTVAINNVFGDGSEIACISCDYFRVGFLAGKHLLAHGGRRIAYVTDDLNHPETSVELSGLRSALEMGGVELPDEQILETRRNPNLARDYMVDFFRRVHVDGCFVRQGAQIGQLMAVLNSRGLNDASGDLQIVVSGDYGLEIRRQGALTVVDNRLRDMCRAGLKTLRRLAGGEKKEIPGLLLLPPRMVNQ